VEIHKPKPWHGVREFLKEYAIIVLGVLTALSAEAVVERLHENRLSAEARESVRGEINLDLAGAGQRDEWQPCIGARFAEIDAALAAADAGKPFRPMAYIGRPSAFALYNQRWEAATSGGRTSLLSSDEQRDFARVYAQLLILAERQDQETQAWARLRALEGVAHPSAETLARAREALSEARQADYNIRRAMLGVRAYAARLGIKGDAKLVDFNHRTASVCVPTTTPREAVAALTKDAIGAP